MEPSPHHERIEDPNFRRAVDLLDSGDAAGLRDWLRENPDLSRRRISFEDGNYFRNPCLLEFIAENPVRRGVLPPNIVAIAEVIIDAGVDRSSLDEALMLVSTGRVPRECGVQLPLIELLCDCGANPAAALHAALLHRELDAAHVLIARGAKIDLPTASALGQLEDARRLLPDSTPESRHLALALAAQFGRADIVRLLLNSGVDPDRYNPKGAHSQSTPLHQAAYAGHDAVVRLLVERGARLDIKDTRWHGTPADWAHHGDHPKLEAFLRACEKPPL